MAHKKQNLPSSAETVAGNHGNAEHAVATLNRIRRTLAKQGVKVTQKEIKSWINEGRR